MGIITITTDFGLIDGYVGVMKGVIWGIAPDVKIVDITHNIPSQDVFQGAISLLKTSPFFPAGTVHIAVIDPGVGTHRRALAAHIGSQFYVLPDNGLLSYLLEFAKKKRLLIEIVELNRSEFWLDEISNVFHGRDIFAPVGAHLSNGKKLSSLGSPMKDPIILKLPKVTIENVRVVGEVISIDKFGNVTTNISGDQLKFLGENILIRVNDLVVRKLIKPIGERFESAIYGMFDQWFELIIVFDDLTKLHEYNIKVGDIVIISKGDQ